MLKACGLRARGKRRFKATTNSAHDLPVAPNLLARNFTVDAPNKVWTGNTPISGPKRAGFTLPW
jgi:putative transposase